MREPIARPRTPPIVAVALGALLVTSVTSDAWGEPAAKGYTLDGAPLTPGTTVEAVSTSARELALGDGVAVVLHPGASVHVTKPGWFPPENGPKVVPGPQLVLREGEITVRMPDAAEPPRALSVLLRGGGQTALAWRGVTHLVARDGGLSVAVDEGAAYVGAAQKWLRVGARGGVALGAKEEPRTLRTRLPPPEPPSAALGFVVGESLASIRIAWKTMSSVARHRLEVVRAGGPHPVTSYEEVGATASETAVRLPRGKHAVRLYGIGPDGVPSSPSPWTILEVKPLTLPAGATMADDGVLVLPPDGVLELDPAARFEVASAGGEDVSSAWHTVLTRPFYPSSGRIRLDGASARAVRIRDATGAEGRLLLAKRVLKAKLTMGPARARWPQTPIDVSVTLESPGGRLDLSAEPVNLEVRVDSSPVVCEWTREGATFRTRIPPREGPGPWLVSVVARDARNVEIGSHVLDLDGSRQFAVRLPESERPSNRSVVVFAKPGK